MVLILVLSMSLENILVCFPMEYSCNSFWKHLVFQMKNLVIQLKYLVFDRKPFSNLKFEI